MVNELLLVILTAMAPISELRGAIPLGFGLGLDAYIIVIFAVIANCLIFFPVFFGLKYFYKKVLCKSKFVCNKIKSTRKKRKYVDKYGYLGLALIVAIPLPFTGAWTGTILAWLLDLDWKKSFLAVCSGVLIAGAIVTVLTIGIINGF